MNFCAARTCGARTSGIIKPHYTGGPIIVGCRLVGGKEKAETGNVRKRQIMPSIQSTMHNHPSQSQLSTIEIASTYKDQEVNTTVTILLYIQQRNNKSPVKIKIQH
jgi:hypothetical protein